MRSGLKPSELKLKNLDVDVIEKMYKDHWDEYHTTGGVDTWFKVIMRFLEYKGYELTKKETD